LRKDVQERGPELNVPYPAVPVKKAKARKKPYIHKAKDYRPKIRYVRVERVKKGKTFTEELEEERARAKLRETRDTPAEGEKLKLASIRDTPKNLNPGILDFLKKFHVKPAMSDPRAQDLSKHMDPSSGRVRKGSKMFENMFVLESIQPHKGTITVQDLGSGQAIILKPSFDLAKYILMGMNLNLLDLYASGQLSPSYTGAIAPKIDKKTGRLTGVTQTAFKKNQEALDKVLKAEFQFA
jgi:hypothetical protein